MIELFEGDKKDFARQSSKGNQLKWNNGGIWYKADYCGYEGLAEYVISNLLKKSTLKENQFVLYDLEQISYKAVCYNGAKSNDFLKDDWQIITIERLYKNFTGQSLYEQTWHISGTQERLAFFVGQIERITGLREFGKYINILLTIDALFLNEDRHMHNIAVLMNGKGEYDYCPIFDQGAGLLSDTLMDYPIGEDIYSIIDSVKAKTVCDSFDEQLEASEMLYGCNIRFRFSKKDVECLLEAVNIYPNEITERVKTVIFEQMSIYGYLFDKTS